MYVKENPDKENVRISQTSIQKKPFTELSKTQFFPERIVKKVFVKTLPDSQENTCVGVSFLIKLHAPSVTFFKIKIPVHVYSIQ